MPKVYVDVPLAYRDPPTPQFEPGSNHEIQLWLCVVLALQG